jgi:hypothetical protein
VGSVHTASYVQKTEIKKNYTAENQRGGKALTIKPGDNLGNSLLKEWINGLCQEQQVKAVTARGDLDRRIDSRLRGVVTVTLQQPKRIR